MYVGEEVTVSNYAANETWIHSDEFTFTDNSVEAGESLTFTNKTVINSKVAANARNVIFEAPHIFFQNSGTGISIRNDVNNSITFDNSSVNFDEAIWNTNATYIGRVFFTGTSSVNITPNSKGKTLIHASTLSGTITLDVEDGVQDGDTFLIEATDNQLVITDGEWTATPSTIGNVTTYTLARSAPSSKTRLLFTGGKTRLLYTGNKLRFLEGK